MCFCSDIKRQFETLLKWGKDTFFPDMASGIGEDPLLYNGTQGRWNTKAGQQAFSFGGCVDLVGGEYFYTPSIPFLKNLI